MPSRSPVAALRDMLENIERARELTVDGDRERFAADWRSVYAATRCLEIVSEASRRLEDGLKARHPDVPWRDVADAGNIYRHAYEAVDPRRIWDTIVDALPVLEAALRSELRSSAAQ